MLSLNFGRRPDLDPDQWF